MPFVELTQILDGRNWQQKSDGTWGNVPDTKYGPHVINTAFLVSYAPSTTLSNDLPCLYVRTTTGYLDATPDAKETLDALLLKE